MKVFEKQPDPRILEWKYGQLPPVENVAWDSLYILFSDCGYCGYVQPTGDKLNPLRWGDHSYFPLWGNKSPVGWWICVRNGSNPRPDYVMTWKEYINQ